MNKCFFKNKFRVLIESSYSGVACRSKNCFTEIVATRIVLQKQQKKNEVSRYLQKLKYQHFSLHDDNQLPKFSARSSFKSYTLEMASCKLQQNAVAFSSFWRVWLAIATIVLVMAISFRKRKNVPVGHEIKKMKRHSKKKKMRHKRYNYHF